MLEGFVKCCTMVNCCKQQSDIVASNRSGPFRLEFHLDLLWKFDQIT